MSDIPAYEVAQQLDNTTLVADHFLEGGARFFEAQFVDSLSFPHAVSLLLSVPPFDQDLDDPLATTSTARPKHTATLHVLDGLLLIQRRYAA